MIEKIGKKRINVDLTPVMYEKLKGISVEVGLPMSAIVTYALMNFLDQREAFAMTDLYKNLEKNKIMGR